jgi:hypothetical protein
MRSPSGDHAGPVSTASLLVSLSSVSVPRWST